MRGEDRRSGGLFSYVDLEARVPASHPRRVIRGIVNDVLDGMSSDFEAAYARAGRPSIPPEKLLRAVLLQAFYTIRSERQLMENRNGLVVGGGVTLASGTAEREAALDMIDKHRPMDAKGGKRRITSGGDRGYDVADFVEELRERGGTPHVAVQDHLTKTGKRRKTKIDGRTTRPSGYTVSQRIRKRIEAVFGRVKDPGGRDKTKFRGRDRVAAAFTLALAAYDRIRLPRLPAEMPT